MHASASVWAPASAVFRCALALPGCVSGPAHARAACAQCALRCALSIVHCALSVERRASCVVRGRCHVRIRSQVHARSYTHTCKRTCNLIRMRTCMRTCMHTCMRTCAFACWSAVAGCAHEWFCARRGVPGRHPPAHVVGKRSHSRAGVNARWRVYVKAGAHAHAHAHTYANALEIDRAPRRT